MRKSLVCLMAAGAALALTAKSAKADLVYSFETGDAAGPTDGFQGITPPPGSAPSAASVASQSTVGVTQGSNSLEVLVPQNTYYTTGAIAATNYVPIALTQSTTATYSLTLDASNFGYGQIVPQFDITAPNGTSTPTEHFLSSDFGAQANLGGQTFTDKSVLLNLAVFKDPDGANDGAGTAAVYTVGQIIANDSSYENLTFSAAAFQLAFQDPGTADGSSVPYYFDDFETPATPEPASMSIIAVGGTLMLRRRRRSASIA